MKCFRFSGLCVWHALCSSNPWYRGPHCSHENQMPYRRNSRPLGKSRRFRVMGCILVVAAAVCLILKFKSDRFVRPDETKSFTGQITAWDRLKYTVPATPGALPRRELQKDRAVYPYSVIPGGVRDPQALRDVVSRDAVVAAHYSGFKLANAQVIRLRSTRTAYVSYRLGNKVYWTRRKVKLAAGQKVITDGKNFARVRCGNRFTESPGGEISPDEPAPDVLDRPEKSPDPEVAGVPWVGDPSPDPIPGFIYPPPAFWPPPDLPIGIFPSPPPPPSSPPVFIPPILPPSGPPSPPETPPAATPEPSTLLLFTSGLTGWIAIRRKLKK
jgi:hypothetical protein